MRGLDVVSANRPLYLIAAAPRDDKVVRLVISLKRLLDSGPDAASRTRLVWLILEAVACNAVESDPAEREAFQTSLRGLVTRMEESKGSDVALVLVGEAIKSIETYNRGVQRSLSSQMKELQSIVSLFIRSMLQVSKGSAASATKLRQIERQIEKASQSEDLRALKTQLEQSLETICEEAAQQEQQSEQLGEQIRETMSRPETAAVLAKAVADLDLVTGLPNFQAAEQAIRAAITAHTSTYAVLLCVDRLEVINTRFGFAVGDRILMLFGQHLAQRLSTTDQLFRWRGPGFLAILDRTGPEISIRAEVARMVSARLEQEIELGGRSVLLPVAASWMLTGVADSTADRIMKKLDAFSAKQFGGSSD
jgi:diguanylate cyclase (GGDEF)-like protein